MRVQLLLLAAVILSAWAATPKRGGDNEFNITICSEPAMEAYFKTQSVTIDPPKPARGKWTFNIVGRAAREMQEAKLKISTSMCFDVDDCVVVDTRVIEPCEVPPCNFKEGSATLFLKQDVPSIAPAGDYRVDILGQAKVLSQIHNFTCIKVGFSLS